MIALGNHIDGILIGDRAAAMHVVGCGQCKESQSGLEIVCTKGWWLYRVCLPKCARPRRAEVPAYDGRAQPLGDRKLAPRLLDFVFGDNQFQLRKGRRQQFWAAIRHFAINHFHIAPDPAAQE